jgi:hypothetical protein
MRRKYPSDISRKQFEEIKAELLSATKATKPRKYDIYDVFCPILYLVKEGSVLGVQFRMIFRIGQQFTIIDI